MKSCPSPFKREVNMYYSFKKYFTIGWEIGCCIKCKVQPASALPAVNIKQCLQQACINALFQLQNVSLFYKYIGKIKREMHVCFFYCIYLVYCQRWEKACQTSIMYHFLKIKNIYTDIYNYKTFNLCIGFFVFLYYI